MKLAAETVHRRSADALGMYGREVAFYRDLAGVVPLRTPRLHLAEAAEVSTDFVLVVEDLGGLAPADQLAGIGLLQAEAAVDAVARLHAWCWEDGARLDALCDRFPPLRNETTSAMYPSYFNAGWASYLEHVEHEPSAVLALVAERWPAALPWLLNGLAAPSTLCHGDYRADNLFFEADGSMVAVDFQLVHQGCGISDVGLPGVAEPRGCSSA